MLPNPQDVFQEERGVRPELGGRRRFHVSARRGRGPNAWVVFAPLRSPYVSAIRWGAPPNPQRRITAAAEARVMAAADIGPKCPNDARKN
ncbi:Protein of unknown function [Gryllus bimaculatus]|nr:Protein of unknown function [Gryllus bimaculatus]